MVAVQVEEPVKVFRVHSDILSQSSMFRAKIQHYGYENSIVISDITAPMFDLVLRFLYGSPFEKWKYALAVEAGSEESKINALRPACEILCFALNYDLVELKDVIASHIRDIQHVSYRSILAAAKFVYSNAPSIEPWFREFVIDSTQEALADPCLADESWFVEIFEHGHNGLSKDIFQCYKKLHRLLKREVFTPTSTQVSALERGRSIEPEDDALPAQLHQEISYTKIDNNQRSRGESPCPISESASCFPLEESVAEPEPEMMEAVPAEPEPEMMEDVPADAEPDLGQIEDVQVEPESEWAEEATAVPALDLVMDESVVQEPEWAEEVSAEVAQAEETGSTYGEVPTGISVKRGACTKRQHHLKKMSRWQYCPLCKEEVVAMATSAAQRWVA